ncbi:beta-propeller fold lactonase family protein [Kibdelosporangium philippinense]|uniref:Beta-propeller fold lactonase family protein n=1 Tax=Kibdelosporangium philippinense TaxID=211113 RepID=A0ABS8ZAS9_9PSEU|nr:beta-propeller fold lactonase family protein [Kibdelosporangium philippinense]MCE7003633.1 beta-propeller fold lactonase family protein [Kibdelosporangium philippinense]
MTKTTKILFVAALAVALVASCTSPPRHPGEHMPGMSQSGAPMTNLPSEPNPSAPALGDQLPGMPPVTDPKNIDAAAGTGMLLPAVAADKPLVYVPHNKSGDVWMIDPMTYQVVGKTHVGGELQHVVPSWDMRTLYATDDKTNRVMSFDARTGRAGSVFPVIDPYNMYFTPDGKYAISVAEGLRKLVWYDPHTWQIHDETPTPDCAGIDHADFSADGRTVVFTCEFAGRVAVVDVPSHKVLRMIDMTHRHTHMGPQDIKVAPDGSVYYIADSDAGGLWVLDGAATHVLRFIPTGKGAHGLYLSRDAKRLFVTNRGEGSVTVLDAYTGSPVTTWRIPGGGSPDMGNVTADGTQLWLSGRYNDVVYVMSTKDGSVIKTIPVGAGPHGLCVWPQPGRYSLGHTGITR